MYIGDVSVLSKNKSVDLLRWPCQ